MILKYIEKFYIRGRGDVYTISMKENNLKPFFGGRENDIKVGDIVILGGVEFKVKGIEAFAVMSEQDKIGLLVTSP